MISNKIITKEFLMELVYLWVEGYKNIEKQGFNFSPRFRCEFDEDTKELNIIDKDETGEFYPKDFFGENINVTAIVGENGSGKSSIIECLEMLIKSFSKEDDIEYEFYHSEYIFNSIILFKDENNYYDIGLNKLNFQNIIKIKPSDKKISNIILERIEVSFKENISLFILEYFEQLKINKFNFFIPDIIAVDLLGIEGIEKLISFKDKIKYFLDLEKNKITLTEKEAKKIDTSFDMGYSQKFKKILKLVELNENFNINPDYESGFLYSFKIKDKDFIENNKVFFSLLGEFNLIDFHDSSKKELHEYRIGNFGLTLNELSLGEKNYLKIYLKLSYLINNSKTNIIILDEPEITLHPDWQKRFILENLELFRNKKDIHLIITSHSPFILSDLPKENIIFLEKGKQVYPFEDGKQTFGANIHTLLSHGFFMKDGLMGEFTKDKIQSIIKYHEDMEKKEIIEADKIEYKTKKQKEFWQIQSIIGDDYLKQVIKNHLIEIEKIVLGTDEAKQEEIIRLEAQIEQLKK